ncbi:type I restriction-modification system subunit M N-terminal domain-containing protein [Pedobacter sp. NJ-S-72]
MLPSIIKNKVKELWKQFWSGGISNPLNAIEQITYLLFLKQLDENDEIKIINAKQVGQKNINQYLMGQLKRNEKMEQS